ncbi:MAG: hypothetical protein WBB82_11325 [Limnothrix sp.]
MTSLMDIEAAIKNLSENDARQLSEWIQEYVSDQWDRQIEADFASGKLDQLIATAEANIAENQVKELNEILHNS